MSSRRSSSLPSSSQLWTEATSSLNCVCSRDSDETRHFSCSPTLCTDGSVAALTRSDQAQSEAIRVRCCGKLIRRPSRNSSDSRLWHLSCSQQSTSSAVLPAASSLSLSSNATGFDQDEAAGLAAERAFDYYLLEKRMLLTLLHANAPSRCSHPHSQSIPAPAGRVAPAQAVEPAILTPAVPAPEWRRKSAGCARKASPLHACRRSPLLRVNCAHAAAAAAQPHACSDCACLPVMPDKPRLCPLVVWPITSE